MNPMMMMMMSGKQPNFSLPLIMQSDVIFFEGMMGPWGMGGGKQITLLSENSIQIHFLGGGCGGGCM